MEFTYMCKTCLNGNQESWLCTLCPLMPFDCTEYKIRARGSCFHLIICKHQYSTYIYITTWNIAIDISYLDDRFCNLEHLLQSYPELSSVDAVSIVEALVAIKKHNC